MAGITGGFNKYAAGAKRYGMIRDAPNIGPVDPQGYAERDLRMAARKRAIMKRLRSGANKEGELG